MYMNVLPACLYVHPKCAQWQWRSEDSVQSSGTEVTGGSFCHVGAENQTEILWKGSQYS